jgi:mono/diheme cytochrome c family protein
MITRLLCHRGAAGVIGALILGCGNDQSTAPPGQARFSDVQEILSQDCGSCHGAAPDRFFKVSMDSAALHQSGLVDPPTRRRA